MDDSPPKELKMWLLVRKDIDIPSSKLAAQAGHGFLVAFNNAQKTHPDRCDEYLQKGQPKIVVSVKNEYQMKKLFDKLNETDIPSSYIVDEGRTIFSEPTATVVACGPCYKDELPKEVAKLNLRNN